MKEYKNAFSCKKGKCFENDSCPCWTELLETNIETGKERINKSCLFQLLPMMLVEVIKGSNRPAEAIESTRNEIVKGFTALAISINSKQIGV